MHPLSRATLAAAVLSALAGPAGGQAALDPFQEAAGIAQVMEGDLLSVGGTLVRLYGLDAPDPGQTCRRRSGAAYDCGAAARAMLERLVGTADVACTLYAQGPGGALLGTCLVGQTDIGAAMVLAGWAFSDRSWSDRYERHESRAQARRAGLWSGRAERPWQWRAAQGIPAPR